MKQTLIITGLILTLLIGTLYYNFPMYFVPDLSFYLNPDPCVWGGE